jgi:hypothetical protein
MAAFSKAELPGLVIAPPMCCPFFDSLTHFTSSTSLPIFITFDPKSQENNNIPT